MRLSRGFVILAIVAALWGAPSTASAAVNELRSPQLSPSSGSVTTVFTFRVRYEGGFPAATVGVTVAGLTVPMGLDPVALPFTVASTNHGATRMRPDAERSDAQATTDDPVANVLLLGLAGVASVAIVGTLLLVASRRRGPERTPANAAPDPAQSIAEDAAMRRIAITGRGRAADDPILAALGVDDEMAARRAIRRSLRETPDDAKHPARRVRER